jgi:hypothetical protein
MALLRSSAIRLRGRRHPVRGRGGPGPTLHSIGKSVGARHVSPDLLSATSMTLSAAGETSAFVALGRGEPASGLTKERRRSGGAGRALGHACDRPRARQRTRGITEAAPTSAPAVPVLRSPNSRPPPVASPAGNYGADWSLRFTLETGLNGNNSAASWWRSCRNWWPRVLNPQRCAPRSYTEPPMRQAKQYQPVS